MYKVTLDPGEFTEAYFPCNALLESITVRADGGSVVIDVQASRDGGLTFASPVANARLKSEEKKIPLELQEGVKTLRLTLHNGSGKPATVDVDDFPNPNVTLGIPAARKPKATAKAC